MKGTETICVVTSTRAEYGLLFWLMKAIEKSRRLKLNLVVTGAHLSEAHGNTHRFIESDGFSIDEKIETMTSGTSVNEVGNAAGNTVGRFTAYFSQKKPSAVVLLGDRYEILSIAQAAALTALPVVHLHGGEITEGANDNLFRHAITKLSALHFTSTVLHRKRVIQMGEKPSTVKVSGALGIENIRRLNLLSKAELEKTYKVRMVEPVFLVTFHPATLERQEPAEQVPILLDALNAFPRATVFISGSNADAGGQQINAMLMDYAAKRLNVVFAMSFGQLNYLSLMRQSNVVIGNSSSGILEAPSMNKPTVNIGTRQKGRMCARSVIHCAVSVKAITAAIKKALLVKGTGVYKNPYDHGDASQMIVSALERTDFGLLLPKQFHDLT